MKLRSLLNGVEIIGTNAELDADIETVASDSRKADIGGMFICISGRNRDGHQFIDEAVDRGASVVVAERTDKIPEGVKFVLTPDTRLAEAIIYNNFYGDPTADMTVIAVTGTNGKTSVAFMLRDIFEASGKKTGLISTVETSCGDISYDLCGGSSVVGADGAMTTPDPEYFYGVIGKMKEAGAEALIFEASSHALALRKIDPVSIDVAVFTNLSEEHLDFHGNMENYFQAKARLAELSKYSVINSDDSYMRRLAHTSEKSNAITCSADDGSISADATALRVKMNGVRGIEYIYFSRRAVFNLNCPIPGKFTVCNTLLAATAALCAGIPAECVRNALASIKGVRGRLEKLNFEFEVPFTVIIDYAHTPAALETLLETLRALRSPEQKLTVLFGCGGDRDRSKRRKMGAVASRLADFVIVTGDNSRSEDVRDITEEIARGVDREKPHAVINDRESAIRYAIENAVENEIVVLAGKGHEVYEINECGKRPFDERKIVTDALKKRFLE